MRKYIIHEKHAVLIRNNRYDKGAQILNFLNISRMYFVFTDIADLASSYKNLLSADPGAKYDQVIDINLDTVSVSFAPQSCDLLVNV